MSTTIDQRIVEMRFDNKDFERNVQISLSTLDKLKQKLHFDGASKGLDTLNKSVKNVDFSPMEDSAGRVAVALSHKWATLQHQIDRTVDHMVDSAKKAVSALTIDPIKTGLQEYETQIGAVQTIMANTSHQGTTLNDVNQALDTLNQYADKTIYNFTEMTRNIGTFTAAGVDLQTSVESIQGIANLAAVSGSTSQQASTAMYQLSQALAAGKVSLMDWNSVVNAGMGGKLFQDSLIRTSELLQTGAQDAIDTYGSFRESLTKGEWLTTEVLTETLKQLSGAYTEADLIAQGFTESQAKEITELANTASEAATKVKTFTQLWDTLKEAAQSGWTQTWELIIGDFEEAKELWTGVSDVIGNFINNMSEARNNLLAGALNSPWEKLVDTLGKAGVSADEFEEKVIAVAEKNGVNIDKIMSQYDSFEEACRSGAISADILKKSMVELAGSTVDLSNITKELKMGDVGEEVKQVQEALSNLGFNLDEYGIDGIIGAETEAAIKAFQEAQGLKVTGIVDESTLRALEEASKNTKFLIGDIYRLINGLDDLGGRELLIQGLSNIFNALKAIIAPIADAFREIFPPATSKQLYNLIEGFTAFTETLKPSDELLSNLHDTFAGLFSIVDILWTVIKAVGKGVLGIIGRVLGSSGGLLKMTAAIGRFITEFRDALKNGNLIENFVNVAAAAFGKLLSFVSIPIDIIAGFIRGFEIGATPIISAIIDFASKILQTFCDILGIHSPSTETTEMGKNLVEGFIVGIKDWATKIWPTIKEFGVYVIGVFKDMFKSLFESLRTVQIGDITSFLFSATTLATIKEIINIMKAVRNSVVKTVLVFEGIKTAMEGAKDMLGGIGKMFTGIGGMFESFGDGFEALSKGLASSFKANAWKKRGQAILSIALAIGVLAASLYLISKIDHSRLWESVGVIAAIAAILGVLSFAMGKFGANDGLSAGVFVGLAASLFIIASALKKVASIPAEDLGRAMITLGGVILGLTVIVAALGFFVKGPAMKYINNAGKMFLKLSAALLLMMLVIKIASMLNDNTVKRGMKVITKVGILFLAFVAVSKLAGQYANKAGGMLLKMSIAMLIMVGVVKLAAGIPDGHIKKGLKVIRQIGLVFAAVIAVSYIAGKNASKAGSMLLKMSIAMLIMVYVIKTLSGISAGRIKVGLKVIWQIGILFTAFIAVSAIAGKYGTRAGTMLIGMSVAMLILAGVIAILGTMEESKVETGLRAIKSMFGCFATIILVAAIAGKSKGMLGALITMTVAIVLLTGIVIALTFIPKKSLEKSVNALTKMMLSFAVMLAAAKFIGDGKGLIKSLTSMLIMVGVLALIVALLSGVNADDSIVKTMTALSTLLIAMSASIVIISKAGKISKSALGAMATITLVIAALGGILGLMNHLGVEGSIQTATALGILLNAMAASLLILDHVRSVSVKAIGAMALIGLVVLEIAAVLWVIQKMDITPSIPLAISLGVLLLAMSASCLILGAVGPIAGQAILGAAALTVVIGIIGLFIAALGGLVDEFPQLETFLNKGIPILEKIGQGIGKFIGGIFGGIGEGIVDSLPNISEKLTEFVNQFSSIDEGALDGAKNLIAVIGEIAGLSVGTQIADIFTFGGTAMDEFKANGVAFMEAMGEISTAASGVTVNSASISSIADAASELTVLQDSIEPIGGLASAFKGHTDLGTFGESAAGFIGSMKTAMGALPEDIKFNNKALKQIVKAGEDLAALQGIIEPIGGLATLIKGTTSLSAFGLDVSIFLGQMKIALRAIPEDFTFNNKALKQIIKAGEDLADLQSSVEPIGGLVTLMKGKDDLGTFGLSVQSFIGSIKTAIEGIPEDFVVPTCIGDIVSTATELAGLQESIEPIGGLVSAIKGKTDLGTWGESIGEFVSGISEIKSLGGEGGITQETIDSIKNVSTMLTEVQNAIPTKSWLDGKVTLSDWGLEIDGFATSISDFATKCVNMDTTGIDTAISTAWRLQALVNTLQTIDMSGIEQFTGVGVGMAGADGAVSDIADAMVAFSTKVADINVEAVNTSVTAAGKLKSLINGLKGLDTSGIANFKVEDIGLAMKNYISHISGMNVEKVNTSVNTAHSLKRLISGLAGLDTSGVNVFISAIEELCNIDVSDFKVPDLSSLGSDVVISIANGVTFNAESLSTAMSTIMTKAIENITKAYDSFKMLGSQLAEMIMAGLRVGGARIIIPVSLMLGTAITQIRAKYTNFKTAGEWLGDGLVQGMKNKEDDAYRAGYRLGQKAVEGEKEGQKSNSPSKLTEQAGKWLGEGLVIGINRMTNSVYKSGKNLGKTAADSMTTTASRLAAAIDTDIDSQPTIRPVLDLSGVEAGAGSISTMLSGSTIGVTANVGAISTMMNNRRQNGPNAEIVSAIGKLNDRLNNLGNTTYQVNGITYDDGSNISAAVRSLVHAAKVERRI